MPRVCLAACIAYVSFLAVPVAHAQDLYRTQAGPAKVKVEDQVWHDAARGREVPVRIYIPAEPTPANADAKAPPATHPFIVFSHGLGGSGRNYQYFGAHMASWGYLVIAPTHHGSDTAALLEWMKGHRADDDKQPNPRSGWLQSSINDPDNLKNRPLDISFVIDHALQDAALAPMIDADRIGVGGHSFGAYTAMAVAGMLVDLPGDPDHSFRDPRVKAVLPMSPQGGETMGINAGAWDKVGVPVLFLTGTKDYGNGERAADWRREAFDHIAGVDTYLVVLNGATHMTFGQGVEGEDEPVVETPDSGKPGGAIRRRIRERVRDKMSENTGGRDPDQARHTRMIHSICTAFFDAYLSHDESATKWLKDFATTKHDDCTAELKPGSVK